MNTYLKTTLLFIFCITCSTYLQAQSVPAAFGYYSDAMRFSQTSFGTTARFQGIGGAGIALGGDAGSIHVNPAGLGFNRRSELNLTPALGISSASADYLNNTTSDSKGNVNFNHLSAIFTGPQTSNSLFRGGSFGISLTRINDFHNKVSYSGVNAGSDITTSFFEQSEGNLTWDYMESQGNDIFDINAMAYYAYLINPDVEFDNGDENTYFVFLPEQPTLQSEEIKTSGAQYEWNFSYGGNYNDRIYFGVGLGIQTIRYEQERTYTESLPTSDTLQNLTLADNLEIKGTGINLKAGVILRLSDYVRLGLTATTPTWYRISDTYSADLSVSYDEDFLFVETSGEAILLGDMSFSTAVLESSYTLVSPFRLGVGISSFVGKKGFVSADVEYVGYTNTKLKNPDGDFSFSEDNEVIREGYESSYNFRVGGELRLNKIQLRAGAAYYLDPVRDDLSDAWTSFLGESQNQLYLTGGVGTRTKEYYLDLAVIANVSDDKYTPYKLADGSEPTAEISNTKVRGVLSFGLFF